MKFDESLSSAGRFVPSGGQMYIDQTNSRFLRQSALFQIDALIGRAL
jgi:hypothetical protein